MAIAEAAEMAAYPVAEMAEDGEALAARAALEATAASWREGGS